MTSGIPGIEVIQAAAARQGIDISATIVKAEQVMAVNTAAMRAGSARLRTTASGLDTTRQDVHRTGTDMLANWTGDSADAFAPRHADVVNRIGSQRDGVAGAADQVDAVVPGIESRQQAVLAATGIAATAIGTQQATP